MINTNNPGEADSDNRDARIAVVAGATGYLGKYVIRALARAGWRIRALARDEARLGEVRHLCDEVVVAEATDAAAVAGLCEGAQALFSSIGIRHMRRRPTYEEVDYAANLNLVREAERAKVKRFVFVSILGGAELRATSPLVEARERVVDALRDSPLAYTILRPTGFFNDMGDFLEMARKGKVWLIGNGETRINPVHGADLAAVAATAMSERGESREVDVGGPTSYSQKEIADLCFSALGTKAKYGRVSPKLIRFLATAIRPFNRNASAIALMFSNLGDRDAVATAYGNRELPDHFASLVRPV